jgi:outer membrane autotransporter protein
MARGYFRVRRDLIAASATISLTAMGCDFAFAQVCPSPAVVNNSQCTVPPGTTITVTPANAVGLSAAGASGQITANGITDNLAAAGTTGGLAQSGSSIFFNGSTLQSTATVAANANNQTGLHATGAGIISADGATITLAPRNAADTAFLASSFMVGALADGGGGLSFNNTTITTQATATPAIGNNHGLVADGTGSTIHFTRGSVNVLTSRGSFGVFAENGGSITLDGGAQVISSGANIVATQVGSHALYALGSNSVITGTDIVVSASGTIANGARAEAGGRIDLSNSQVSTTGGNVATPAIAAHALIATGAGSVLNGDHVVASATGNLANGARAENGGVVNLISSQISTNSPVNGNSQNPAAAAVSGGILNISGAGSTLTTGALGRSSHGLLVQDAGSIATVSNTAISVSASGANGVQIANGGTASVTGSSITNSSTSATYGILAIDAGSSATLTDTTIVATNQVQGARAQLGGALTFNGGSVTVSDPNSLNVNRVGLWATSGSTITANNVTVSTQGAGGAHGVRADNPNTLINLNGGSITTTGSFLGAVEPPNGISARDRAQIVSVGTTVSTFGTGGGGAVSENSTINLRNNSVSTVGDLSVGLYATINTSSPVPAPSTLTAAHVTVQTGGAFSHGAFAAQKDSAFAALLTLDNSSVTTLGDRSVGLRATGRGTVIADQTTALTFGSAAHGVEAADVGSSVTFMDSRVSAVGNNAHGALANRGGLVIGNNSTVFATGANGMALYVAGDSRVSNAQFTGSTLMNVSGPIIGVGGVGNVSLTDSTAQKAPGAANGEWLRVGTINDFPVLTAPDQPRQVLMDLDGLVGAPPLLGAPPPLAVIPGLANVTLTRSTVIGSAFTAPGSVSNVTLQDNSTWIMTGNSNVTNLVNDPSLIQFTPPVGDPTLLSSYKTLTAVNYLGVGGLIGLNTFLGSDPSPSDRLVIDGGTASGLSPLRIANTTGRGDLTHGNGILVVDTVNAGTTASGTFALAAPVVAGPYEYGLFRSSVDASNPDAWYLRSTLNCALEPTNPACQPPVPPPNYRIETSLYAAIPSMALLYGRNLLDTLHERVGEEEDGRFRASPENGKVGWGRIIGVNGTQHGDSLGVLGGSGGPRYDYAFLALQAGMDVYRHDRPDGSRDQAGAYFAIGGNQGHVTHFDSRQGDSDFAAYTLGGYWTHFGPRGWYLDAILQGTFYDISSTANRGLPTFKTGAQGAAASLEGGYPFKLAGGYFIEPQAQVVYQNVHINDASDVAAQVHFSDVDSLLARVGARFGRTWSIYDFSQRTITAWIRPNLWNEFRGNPITSFSSETGFIPFHADLGGLWGEVNVGVSGQVTLNTTLYANASYQSRFDGGGFAYTGKAGLRINW